MMAMSQKIRCETPACLLPNPKFWPCSAFLAHPRARRPYQSPRRRDSRSLHLLPALVPYEHKARLGVLHFRASYAEEARRIVNHLVNDGFVRIAVAYQNDAYGKDVLASTVEALQTHDLRAVSTAALPRNSTETTQAANTIVKSKPDALIVISLSKTMASLVNNLHRNNSRPQLMTISPTGTKALFRDLPQSAAFGVGVTQVVPFPWDARHPDVASYQRLLRQQQQDVEVEVDFDFYSLEGFMAAQWLVQAMETIAPEITRDRLINELKRTTPGLHRSIDLVFLGSDPWEP